MNVEAPREFLDRRQLLGALRSLRRGDFSVRLAEDLPGLDTEIARLFNEVVGLNQQMTEEIERLSRVVGKEGKINQRGRDQERDRRLGKRDPIGQRADRGHGPADRRGVARDRRGRQGRPFADHGGRDRRPGAARRVPAHRQGRQHHGRAARLVRFGGDARGPRGRHRRQAGRPGAGQGRRRHLEGSDRQRQRDGDQPHQPGPQHRRGDHRGRLGRPFQEDHRRGEGRDPRAQEHHQRDGRSAQLVRFGSDSRRPRGRYRRQARRPGAGRRRRRHLGRS